MKLYTVTVEVDFVDENIWGLLTMSNVQDPENKDMLTQHIQEAIGRNPIIANVAVMHYEEQVEKLQ